jgi:hypothetical protein
VIVILYVKNCAFSSQLRPYNVQSTPPFPVVVTERGQKLRISDLESKATTTKHGQRVCYLPKFTHRSTIARELLLFWNRVAWNCFGHDAGVLGCPVMCSMMWKHKTDDIPHNAYITSKKFICCDSTDVTCCWSLVWEGVGRTAATAWNK